MITRRQIIEYCLTLPQSYEDYPFDETRDDNATTVMRHKANKKSFALIMKHKGELYLNLKCAPMEADFLRQIYKSVIPGYHMNKTHWNTIVIGGDVPDEEIKRQIGMSYDLIRSKIRRTQQN